MSIEAIAWALNLDVGRSTEKFVLVCLANYADENGVCYPSISRLARDTAQDRKTVMVAIKSLVELGILGDTGRRIGETRSVVVYRLIGLPASSTTHYTYRVTDPATGQFYLGKRSCRGDPEADTYRGSGRWTRLAQAEGRMLHREVLEVFETSAEALGAEARLFRQFDGDPLCMNDGLPSKQRAANKTRSSTENGTAQAVPFFPPSSTVFPSKQYQISAEAVPKTVHRSVRDPSLNQREGDVAPLRRATAARLPDDFTLTPERAEVARREAVDPERTFDGFRDHWTAASGAKARKHDWDAAWRTWCRNENNFRKGPVRAGPAPAVVAANEQRAWEALKARAQAIGFREPYAVETVSAYESAVRIAEMNRPRGPPVDTSAILAKMRMPA